MQEHPNYKYRPRRRKHNKRAGSLGASPPRVQPRTPYTAYGGPYTPVGLHTPDSSPTASPEPETASAPGLLEDPTNPASNLPTPEMSPMEQVSLIYERLLNFQINQGWIQSFGSISSSPSIWFYTFNSSLGVELQALDCWCNPDSLLHICSASLFTVGQSVSFDTGHCEAPRTVSLGLVGLRCLYSVALMCVLLLCWSRNASKGCLVECWLSAAEYQRRWRNLVLRYNSGQFAANTSAQEFSLDSKFEHASYGSVIVH